MAAQVYTFHISYDGLEDRIWRDVEVSSNYSLDKLGYMVLASFDTMAYHLFEFYYGGNRYGLPNEDTLFPRLDMAEFKLHQLGLKIGDSITMNYDFGTPQTFWIELTGVEDMQLGRGNHYPYITNGAGRGILDDYPVEVLMELIEQIDKNGRTDELVWYRGEQRAWDYRWFNKRVMNGVLKMEIMLAADAYAPFWRREPRWRLEG
jgi:hypothetical protein